jgi:AcrR family transcriptional regulator
VDSRERILQAAKRLFAKQGFERTATLAIAHEAGTSESQLVRYFQTKSGVLQAIFDESWASLNHEIQKVVVGATNAREALAGVLEMVTAAFGRDPELAQLLLFEGRRIRGASSEVLLSKGFLEFETLLRVLVHRGTKDNTFRSDLNEFAVASALLGATESMIRDRLMKRETFSDAELRKIFLAMLEGFSPVHHKEDEGDEVKA